MPLPFIVTNVSIYRGIAEDAYAKMQELREAARRPRGDGGWVVTYDPDHRDFRYACIATVFVGIWLEAATHLAIVRDHGVEKAREFDRRLYEDKLRLLGYTDGVLIERAARLRRARNELVHEKAHLDSGEIRFAQDEADNAHDLLVALKDLDSPR